MENNSVLVLGYSRNLSGGVSKVTSHLVDNFKVLELHPVLYCYQPKYRAILTTLGSFFSFAVKLLMHPAQYKLVLVIIGSTGDAIRTLPFVWLAKLFRKPVCTHFHTNTRQIFTSFREYFFHPIITKTWEAISVHCMLSETLARDFAENMQGKVETRVIPNSISDKWLKIEPLSYTQRTRDIVYFGRWSAAKGVDDIIKAMARIDDGYTCEFFSDVPSGTQYKNCILSNWVAEEDVREILKAAKLLLLPSHAEAYPTVLLEAISCHTPFIATDVGGVGDIARQSGQGLLIEVGDIDDLVLKIKTVLEDEDSWRRHQASNSEWFNSHSIDIIKLKWSNLFSEIT